MMYMLMPIPPIPTTVTFNLVWFLGMIGFVLALSLIAIIWAVATWRIAQKQAQMKEAERQYEAPPLPQPEEHTCPPDRVPQVQHEQEEILLRR
jgi:nitrate/nitrite transporter NarK